MDVTEVVVSKSVLNHLISSQDKSSDNFMGYMIQKDGAECWQAPYVDKIKINSDATIFKASNCYNFAVVARNHNGELIKALSRCSQGDISLKMIVIIGIR